MRLHDLLKDLSTHGPMNPDITGLHHDSRRIEPGGLFVAIVGESFDGRRFAKQAVERGAVAVMGPDPAPEGLTVPWVGVNDPRLVLGPMAGRLYGKPHDRLRMVGVTGTNGKGTVSRLLMSIFEAAGFPAGLGGTLGYQLGDRDYCGDLDSAGGPRTTLEASELFRVLRAMADDGAKAMVMEVSSHGLEMHRVAGVQYELGVFTNLTRDHLDFHGDMESYYQAKRLLFTRHMAAKSGRPRAVICVGDDWTRRLAGEMRTLLGDDDVLTCGSETADVHVLESRLDLGGISARMATPRGELEVSSRLLGHFNLLNMVTAVAGAEALGLPREAIVAGLAAERPLPGRLEPVLSGQDFPALVDYAHTPAGIEAALSSIRGLSDKGQSDKGQEGRRILVVFGCGGDRDRGKRPEMGKAAAEHADLVIATSDNPRREDPEAILDDIEPALKEAGTPYLRIADRREAIRKAVAIAASRHQDADWAVLVAGKGHEALQIIGDKKTAFSDRQELQSALEETIHG